jgi:hypothetical protein
MTAPAIPNTLLRLNGVTGEPPSPFERPNSKLDFFVLELGQHDSVDRWCLHVAQALRRHAELLRDLRQAGARATLFVEFASSMPVLRLEASFLSLLSEAGISLECYLHE